MSAQIDVAQLQHARGQWPAHRCELVAGAITISPPRGRWQELAVSRLSTLLDRATPAGDGQVLVDAEVVLGPTTVVRPDLVVVGGGHPHGLPELVVEVLDRSRRAVVTANMRAYASVGIPAVWFVDPLAPSLTAFALTTDTSGVVDLVERASARGDEVLVLTEPFRVAVRPSGLGIE